MICDHCGEPNAQVHITTETFGKDEDLFLIENIPMVFCSSCRERYFTAATLRKIESLKAERDQIAVSRPIKIVRFVA